MATARDVLNRAKELTENGETKKAKRFYQAIIDRMPYSEEAEIAKQYLADLNQLDKPNFDDLFVDDLKKEKDEEKANHRDRLSDNKTLTDEAKKTPDHDKAVRQSLNDVSQNLNKVLINNERHALPNDFKKPQSAKPFYKKVGWWVAVAALIIILITTAVTKGGYVLALCIEIVSFIGLLFTIIFLIIYGVKREKIKLKTYKKLTVIFLCALIISGIFVGIGTDSKKSKQRQKTVTTSNNAKNNNSIDNLITAKKVKGKVKDVSSDKLKEQFEKLGFTEEEATKLRTVFIQCGIKSIKGFKPTDSNASIDNLISYRKKINKDRTEFFTIDHRQLIYIALNGNDVYDIDKGGFLINVNDIHVPESDVSDSDVQELHDMTETELDKYFKHALYYDAFGYGRSDNDYMVQCQIYASNDFHMKDWVYGKVWYTKDSSGNYTVTAVTIDGKRYR